MSERPIVFLHLPKTGGQTIHHAIGSLVGAAAISPLRLQRQVGKGESSFPPGYRMHSGHLAWDRLGDAGEDPFSFTVLRDPRERLGSFFFFMRAETQKVLAASSNTPLNRWQQAFLGPAEAFFFPEDAAFGRSVRGGLANLAVTYLAFRRLNRRPAEQEMPADEVLDLAIAGAHRLSAVYRFPDFTPLEDDIEALLGRRPAIAGRRTNAGSLPEPESRWDALCAELGPARRDEIEDFVDEDLKLLERLTLRTSGVSE